MIVNLQIISDEIFILWGREYLMRYRSRKIIFLFLIVFCLFFIGGCSQKNNDMTKLSGNVNQVTYASETGASDAYTHNNQMPSQNKVLSTFSTEFKGATKGRKNNIMRACEAINEKTVAPGEVFSFNDNVGPTTKNKGFSLAKIFVKGKESEGYGGGVCQVSSTLYNAALEAGMEIVERHPHSKRVYYVEEGKDAATSYGAIDFKFKNTSAGPVKISSAVTGEKLTVNIESV